MAQSFLYRWFGIGGLSRGKRTAIESEGVLFAEEGIWFSIAFKNFKKTGVLIFRRKELTIGSVVLTKKRLAAYRNFSLATVVDLPIDHLPHEKLHVNVNDATVSLRFEVADFIPSQSGEITIRFTTNRSSDIRMALGAA